MKGITLLNICYAQEWRKVEEFLDSEIDMVEKEKILSYQGKRWENYTCLMMCICGSAPEELILKMIRIGKKNMLLKQESTAGHTVLHMACDTSHDRRDLSFPSLREMIDIGGRDLVMTKSKDDSGYALHYLCWSYDCNKEIDEYKRKIEYILEKGDKKLLLLEKSQPPNEDIEFTALDYASKSNAPDSICELLAYDAFHLHEDNCTDSGIQSKVSKSRCMEENKIVQNPLVAKIQNEDKAVRIYLEQSHGASRIEYDSSSISNCEEDAKKFDVGTSLPIVLEGKDGGIRQRNSNQYRVDNSAKDSDGDLDEELNSNLDINPNKTMFVKLQEDETTCSLCTNEFSTDTDSKDEEVRDRLPVISSSKTCSHYYCLGCIRSQAMEKNVAHGKPLDKWLDCPNCRSKGAFRYEEKVEKAPKFHCFLINLKKRAEEPEKNAADIQVSQRGKQRVRNLGHISVSTIQHAVKSSYKKDIEEVKELYCHQLNQANEKWVKKNGKLLAEIGDLEIEICELEVENKILKRKLEELQTYNTAEG